MSMPYHKELLRSSVSLCFREFFVFRNKAKGVMTLLCQFEKMIYPSGTGAADAASFTSLDKGTQPFVVCDR